MSVKKKRDDKNRVRNTRLNMRTTQEERTYFESVLDTVEGKGNVEKLIKIFQFYQQHNGGIK